MGYIVKTPCGELRGISTKYEGIVAYKGIRYAVAERFAYPVEVTHWDGVYDATAYGACAYQPRAFYNEKEMPKKAFYYNEFRRGESYTYSEDCLFLNVFAPEKCEEKLPVIVHMREATEDAMAIVKRHPDLRGVFHCFSGSPEMAQELLKRGCYLGFDGPITYKNARRSPEVVAVTPLDRIVVETDAPYLTPEPFRGKRNDSTKLCYVVEKLAEWKGITPEEMESITMQNGLRLFGLEELA